MKIVLGIDAAWTLTEPSGVALVAGEPGRWHCLCVSPSYDSFLDCASGRKIDWHIGRFTGNTPDVNLLISAARLIAGENPTVVAIDMPVSNTKFTGRRCADRAISKEFGGQGCSTHSPSSTRPGPLGAKLMAELNEAGYPLATCSDYTTHSGRRTIEVYPHPALLTLLNRPYRVPYKVNNSSKYWPKAPMHERIAKLLHEFTEIERSLGRIFGETRVALPMPAEVKTLSYLKRYEDSLDALVSAWVGVEYLAGNATAYGDNTAAIWVPTAVSAT